VRSAGRSAVGALVRTVSDGRRPGGHGDAGDTRRSAWMIRLIQKYVLCAELDASVQYVQPGRCDV